MGKRMASMLVALCLLLPSSVLAEAWNGVTVADTAVAIEAPSSGVLEQLNIKPGQTIEQDEALGEVRMNRVFATQNGTVARIQARSGEHVNGTVLEVQSVGPYRVVCSTSKAYDSAETMVVHAGETLYLRCSDNGTHRAVGFVHHVSGSDYQMELTAGQMYVGEVAYIFRSSDLDKTTCVGIGTVVASDTEAYTAQGTVQRLRVQEGDRVERGQLLYTWSDGTETTVKSPVSGVVLSVSASQGSTVIKDAAVAQAVPWESILIEFKVTEQERARLTLNQPVTFTCATDPAETPRSGCITYLADTADDEGYTVRVTPAEPLKLLGMTVDVRLAE